MCLVVVLWTAHRARAGKKRTSEGAGEEQRIHWSAILAGIAGVMILASLSLATCGPTAFFMAASLAKAKVVETDDVVFSGGKYHEQLRVEVIVDSVELPAHTRYKDAADVLAAISRSFAGSSWTETDVGHNLQFEASQQEEAPLPWRVALPVHRLRLASIDVPGVRLVRTSDSKAHLDVPSGFVTGVSPATATVHLGDRDIIDVGLPAEALGASTDPAIRLEVTHTWSRPKICQTFFGAFRSGWVYAAFLLLGALALGVAFKARDEIYEALIKRSRKLRRKKPRADTPPPPPPIIPNPLPPPVGPPAGAGP